MGQLPKLMTLLTLIATLTPPPVPCYHNKPQTSLPLALPVSLSNCQTQSPCAYMLSSCRPPFSSTLTFLVLAQLLSPLGQLRKSVSSMASLASLDIFPCLLGQLPP